MATTTAHGADADDQSFPRQLAHQLVEALPGLAAQKIARTHTHVVEEQFGGILAFHAKLFEVAPAPEPFCVRGFDHYQRNTARPTLRSGLGNDNDDVSRLSIGDECLAAIKYKIITIFYSSCSNSL